MQPCITMNSRVAGTQKTISFWSRPRRGRTLESRRSKEVPDFRKLLKIRTGSVEKLPQNWEILQDY